MYPVTRLSRQLEAAPASVFLTILALLEADLRLHIRVIHHIQLAISEIVQSLFH